MTERNPLWPDVLTLEEAKDIERTGLPEGYPEDVAYVWDAEHNVYVRSLSDER